MPNAKATKPLNSYGKLPEQALGALLAELKAGREVVVSEGTDWDDDAHEIVLSPVLAPFLRQLQDMIESTPKGRPRRVSAKKALAVLMGQPHRSIVEVAEELGVSRPTLYRLIPGGRRAQKRLTSNGTCSRRRTASPK